jgi:predicted nucleic acid-binding protein
LHYTPQNLIEFWAVATRPNAENGLGLNIADAAQALHDIKSHYVELQDNSDLIAIWERLVSALSVVGKQVHDARLVAVTLVHNVDRILTFDTTHFTRFTDITAVNPADI